MAFGCVLFLVNSSPGDSSEESRDTTVMGSGRKAEPVDVGMAALIPASLKVMSTPLSVGRCGPVDLANGTTLVGPGSGAVCGGAGQASDRTGVAPSRPPNEGTSAAGDRAAGLSAGILG